MSLKVNETKVSPEIKNNNTKLCFYYNVTRPKFGNSGI